MSQAAQAMQKAVDEMKKKTKPAKKSSVKQRRASASDAATPKPDPVALGDITASDLKLAGITANGKNRYFEVSFSNGFVARLQDATATRSDAIKLRDVMVAWLSKHLG